MGFAVRLSSDLVTVAAGATAPITVDVANRVEEPDRFELEVEGLDPEWVAVPVPSFTVGAGETSSERLFFRPPRASESLAGNYPFVVRVRSLNSGEHRTAQGVLQIQPYHHVSVEVSPKKGDVGPFHREDELVVTLVNLGNTEHTLQLLGTDPEEAVVFKFEQDQVTLGPGQQREVPLTIRPTRTKFWASTRLYGFLVTARSMEVPTVAGAAQAQMEVRAFFSPATTIFWAVVGIVGLLWYFNRPQPPSLDIGVNKTQVLTGEPVEISWRAAHANRVVFESGGQVVFRSPKDSGSFVITPKEPGQLVVVGYAQSKDKTSERQQETIAVTQPPAAPDPKIQQFTASSKSPRVGESVIVTYRFGGEVTRAFLQPIGELNTKADQIQVPITTSEKIRLTLIAENREGKTVKETITLTPREESLASVVVFRASPERLPYPGGLVKLIWQLSNSVRAEITPNPNSTDNPEVNAQKGDMVVYIDKTTTFKLTGYDEKSRQVTKSLRVEVEDAPAPSPEEAMPGTGVGPR